jgi:hypothetical protein
LLLALFLLTSAATAHAECAWVLWASASILTAPEKPRETWPDGAFPTRAECDAGRDRKFAGVLTSNTPGITVTRLGELITIMTNEPPRTLTTYSYTCLPDTVDPRGPKGK